MLLDIDGQHKISFAEISWQFARSGGPGGQNVNKVSSKVILQWNPSENKTLPEDVKARLIFKEKNKINSEGYLIITSQRGRDQEQNKKDCLKKLISIIKQAAKRPKPRRPTKPSASAVEKRIAIKKHRSEIKKTRRKFGEID